MIANQDRCKECPGLLVDKTQDVLELYKIRYSLKVIECNDHICYLVNDYNFSSEHVAAHGLGYNRFIHSVMRLSVMHTQQVLSLQGIVSKSTKAQPIRL